MLPISRSTAFLSAFLAVFIAAASGAIVWGFLGPGSAPSRFWQRLLPGEKRRRS